MVVIVHLDGAAMQDPNETVTLMQAGGWDGANAAAAPEELHQPPNHTA